MRRIDHGHSPFLAPFRPTVSRSTCRSDERESAESVCAVPLISTVVTTGFEWQVLSILGMIRVLPQFRPFSFQNNAKYFRKSPNRGDTACAPAQPEVAGTGFRER
jgi:hypothetical protein